MKSSCSHNQTEFLARRDGIDYVRCVDCGFVCEADDLELVSVYDDEEEQVGVTGRAGR